MKIVHCASMALALACASVASAHHHHITIRTPTGTPGEQIQLVVGYYEEESDLAIGSDARIYDGRDPFVVHLPGTFAEGPLAGQFTGTGFSLTSDFYAPDGLLEGGDFYYRIVAIEPVKGDPCVMTWAHTDEQSGEIIPEAQSDGGDPLSQSLHVGIGGHPHGQIMAVSLEGLYDVTLVAWDVNGVYLDSDPVTFTIDAHLNPSDLDENGMVDAEDLALLLGAWGTPDADIDGNGTTDAGDLALLLGAWG